MRFEKLQKRFADLDFELSYERNTYYLREYGKIEPAYEIKGRESIETLLEDLERRHGKNEVEQEVTTEIKTIPLWDGEWEDVEVGSPFLRGVSRQDEIKEMHLRGESLEVHYRWKRDLVEIVYYQKVHGTWGFPAKFR